MSELRKDPITGRWVIISTERGKRPSDFVRESVEIKGKGICPFCPGNEGMTPPEILAYGRKGTGRDTPGWTVRVVPNKFPALGIEGGLDREGHGLFDHMNGVGAHEVIVETPDHNLTMASMSDRAVEEALWAYRDRVVDLKNDRRFRYVLLFKNHGEPAGASLEHTHSQLIALPIVPKRVREEVDNSKRYYDEKERCIFCDMIHQEIETEKRRHPRKRSVHRHHSVCPAISVRDLDSAAAAQLGFREHAESALWLPRSFAPRIFGPLDTVLAKPSYNYVVHTSPIGEEMNDYYHWHIEMMPKLTRVAGFEWGTASTSIPRRPKKPRASSAKPPSRPRRNHHSNGPRG